MPMGELVYPPPPQQVLAITLCHFQASGHSTLTKEDAPLLAQHPAPYCMEMGLGVNHWGGGGCRNYGKMI